MTDVILVRGLRAMGIHGVLSEEQSRAQPFEVDLDVEVDLARAAASDDLDDTLDYAALCDTAARVVTTERFRLMEALAGRIADLVMGDQRVQAVTVTIHKLRPPVPLDMRSAGVCIRRERHD